jgi:hypothetical protein
VLALPPSSPRFVPPRSGRDLVVRLPREVGPRDGLEAGVGGSGSSRGDIPAWNTIGAAEMPAAISRPITHIVNGLPARVISALRGPIAYTFLQLL